MKALTAVAMVLCVTFLHGCAIAPGQHMSESALTNSGSASAANIQLVQITPDLLASEQASTMGSTVPPELLSYQPQPYQIGPGDTLYITVWDHPELTSPAGSQQQTVANGRLVRSDGTLFYPYVGTFKAAGMNIEQLRETISAKLAKYIEKPQVDVSVVGYGSQRITLEGAFTKTDVQQVDAVPLTLGQAIGNAGINTADADLSDLVLTRDGHDYHLNLNAIDNGGGTTPVQNIYLKPGDRLFLPYNDNQEVYVMGEVVRPEAITFKTSGLSLTQALGRAGGLNPVTADGKAVYVIRGAKKMKDKPATVYHLNARSPAAFTLADNFRVKPGDVIWVGAAGVTEFNRVLSQISPFSGIIGNAAIVNRDIVNSP
jgi:polysaccharide export outer membrane protein